MAVSITRTDNAVSTASSSSQTFTDRSFGAEASDRYILVGIVSRASGNQPITGVTIAGAAADEVANIMNGGGSGSTNAAYFMRALSSGTTGTIGISFAGSVLITGIVVYRVTGITGNVFHSSSSITDAPSVNLNIPEGGLAVGVGYTNASASASWTGLTKDLDTAASSGTYSSAFDVFANPATGRTVAISWSSASRSAMVVAALEAAPPSGVPCQMMHYRRLRI